MKNLTFILALTLSACSAFAQATDPTPFDLSASDFTLTSYSGSAFPANMAIGFQSSGTDGNFTNDLTNDVAANGTAAGEWDDEGANGISYRASNSSERGSFLLALDASGRGDIVVTWTVRDITANANTNYIEFQWRAGNSGNFTNLTGDVYQQGTDPDGTIYSVVLPPEAQSLPLLHVRWIYYEIGSGTRDRLAIDDIIVTSVLPIQLSNFSVSAQGPAALLSFATATETNNSHFNIERSNNGTAFKTIGEVRGAGNSLVPQQYTFTDEKPLPGLNYYRLQQVDYDGQSTYSPVRSVVFGKSDAVLLYPAPVASELKVRLDEAFEQDAEWQMLDLAGRTVGQGIFAAEQTEFSLPVGQLPEAVYVLRITDGQRVLTQQFRKQ